MLGAIAARLASGRNFAWIARRVSNDVSARAHALNMKGIYYQKEFQRFYPDNQIAAQVLGYVGVDDNGLAAWKTNSMSNCTAFPAKCTPHGRAPQGLGSSEHDPEPGRNLVLTIDETSSSSPSVLSITPWRRPRL